jgi:uncharacterized protein YneF (UPF0154 family)
MVLDDDENDDVPFKRERTIWVTVFMLVLFLVLSMALGLFLIYSKTSGKQISESPIIHKPIASLISGML